MWTFNSNCEEGKVDQGCLDEDDDGLTGYIAEVGKNNISLTTCCQKDLKTHSVPLIGSRTNGAVWWIGSGAWCLVAYAIPKFGHARQGEKNVGFRLSFFTPQFKSIQLVHKLCKKVSIGLLEQGPAARVSGSILFHVAFV
eukprot:3922316-Amphidinium_carterae.4